MASSAAHEQLPDDASSTTSTIADDYVLPTVPEVVDKLGIGLAQVRIALTGGAVWLADGAELLLITSATKAVSKEWHLTSFERGFMVSSVFIGILFGNLASGIVGDMYGRRFPIVSSFVGIFIFSIASSFAGNAFVLVLWQCLVGVSFGLGQPSQSTLVAETTPTPWRITMTACVLSLFSVGEIYSAFLISADDPTMTHMDWRWLMRMGCVPAAVFGFLTYLFLYQSPSYLDSVGRTAEAKEILEMMRRDNGCEHVSVDFRPQASGSPRNTKLAVGQQLQVVFGSMYILSTIIISFTCFVLNLILYGCLYAFPTLMPKLALDGSPSSQLIIGALWEIPGLLLGIVFGTVLARRNAIKLYLCCTAFSLLLFALLSPHADLDRGGKLGLYFGYYGIKMFPSIGFIVTYLYAAEIFPVQARVTGVAVCLSFGRIAAMLVPLIYEQMLTNTGGHATFFYMLEAFCWVNFVLVHMLPFETSRAPLNDTEGAGTPSSDERLGSKSPPLSRTSYGSVPSDKRV